MTTRVFASIVLGLVLAHGMVRADSPEWQPVVQMDRQVYPSFIIATAAMKSQPSIFCVQVNTSDPSTQVRVELSAASIMDPTVEEFTIEKVGSTVHVIKANFKFAELAKIRQQVPLNVTFAVTINGKDRQERVVTTVLRSINDCPFVWVGIKPDHSDSRDLSPLFAAYVNEEHPAIDSLLKDALGLHLVRQFDGYQSGDARRVLLQVYAIWHVLETRGIKYSSITTVPAESQRVLSQHVRFLQEAISSEQANCVDGSVLFASALRRIGLDVLLVKRPSHMYVAFIVDPKKKMPQALETTMLGNADIKDTGRGHALDDLLNPNWRAKLSWKTFAGAIAVGDRNWDEDRPKWGKEAGYGVIDIEKARKAGIVPIPYTPD